MDTLSCFADLLSESLGSCRCGSNLSYLVTRLNSCSRTVRKWRLPIKCVEILKLYTVGLLCPSMSTLKDGDFWPHDSSFLKFFPLNVFLGLLLSLFTCLNGFLHDSVLTPAPFEVKFSLHVISLKRTMTFPHFSHLVSPAFSPSQLYALLRQMSVQRFSFNSVVSQHCMCPLLLCWIINIIKTSKKMSKSWAFSLRHSPF